MKFSIFSLFALAAVSVLAAPIPNNAASGLAVRDVVDAASNSLVARVEANLAAAETQTNDLAEGKEKGKKDKKKDDKGKKKDGKGKKKGGKGKKKDDKGKKEAKPKSGAN
ncbi:hypothetical protein RhiJN_10963 [Ceratobasidium sp. AG-Ba]|nr:hypothetical protein RhiJN_10963 [Ceratobasidium sp. AG-Ba]QRW11699.1 hypothetical protein RhiLY_10698 [Ceratobasidium sp. AG-Ba]